MTFTVGDKVEAIKNCDGGACRGDKGVAEAYSGGIRVRYCGSAICEQHLDCWKLVSSVNKTMANFAELTKEQELAFSSDQKALYRTGITDSYGNPLQTALLNALLRVNYKALVAQAQADIKEKEAEAAAKIK